MTLQISPYQLMNSAMRYHRNGQLQEAYNLYLQVIDAEPRNFDALHLAGVILVQTGNNAQALPLLDKAIAVRPRDSEVHYNKGNALYNAGHYREALATYSKAIELRPDYGLAFLGQGNALKALGQYQPAIMSYDCSLRLLPNYALTYYNRGNAFRELKLVDHAIQSYQMAITLQPDYPEAQDNLALLLADQKKFGQAREVLQKAINQHPQRPDSYVNLGNILLRTHDFEPAAREFGTALALDPNAYGAHIGLVSCHLAAGRFADAWREFEWRTREAAFAQRAMAYDLRPRWQPGMDCKTLLVWAEQGLGDEIFWGALLDELQTQVPRLLVQMDERLIPLFARQRPQVEFVPRQQTIGADRFDAQIPMGSLALALRPDPGAFAHTARAYLQAEDSQVAQLRQQLCPNGERLIGVTWKSPLAQYSDEKNIPLTAMAPLLQAPDTVYVSLQYGDTDKDIAELKALHGIELAQTPAIDKQNNISALANLVAACDQIISTSNATAHLAGALGKDTLLLLPFGRGRLWYWLNEDQGHSLWYPSIRLIWHKEATSNWTALIDAAQKALAQKR